MKQFKPQLITNDTIPEDAPFPRLVSIKRHGICVIIMKGYDKVMGRSLKPVKNIQFQKRFKPLVEYCNENNCMIQGEAHIDGFISDDMVTYVNSLDEKVPENLKIYAFDFFEVGYEHFPYLVRLEKLKDLHNFSDLIEIIKQVEIENQSQEDDFYKDTIKNGGEGLVIRYDKPYKFGRSTQKELLIYKRVPSPTFDGMIISINQATIVNPMVEKTTNELGRSVTSKKKDDRFLIEQAKDFQVEMIPEGKTEPINFGVAMKGFNTFDRKEVWQRQHQYIGKMIEFECKAYNGVGKPKSATFVRFREDKE